MIPSGPPCSDDRLDEILRRIEKGRDVIIAGDAPSDDWDITDDVAKLIERFYCI